MAFSLGNPGNIGSIPSFGDLVSMFDGMNPDLATVSSAGTADTLAGFQMMAGVYVRSGATAAVTVTTDTAANILTALGPQTDLGMTFMLIYVNLNTSSGAVTMAAGTGVTLSGTTTVPIAGLRVYIGTVTNVATPAVTLQGAFQISSGVAA